LKLYIKNQEMRERHKSKHI